MKKLLVIISALALCVGCCSQKTEKQPKYIFLFIGDGMGATQAHLTDVYLRKTTGDSLNFMYFPYKGMQTTYSLSSYITCSAASGTAIACGQKTLAEHIGVDKDDKPLKSIAYMAKERGMKVGILTTVSVDHATPAVFYAHQPSRHNYHEIGMELPLSGFDYFAGGRFVKPVKDSASVFNSLKENGYTVITSSDSLQYAPQCGKVCVLAPDTRVDYRIDNDCNPFSLAALTEAAIRSLDNPDGFFMMVEGGQVDWACHSNDATTAVGEVISMAEAVEKALEFYRQHPDETLIVVTADHETGGLALGSALYPYYSDIALLKNQKASYAKLEGILKADIENPQVSFTFDHCMNRIAQFYTDDEHPLTLNAYDSLRLRNAYEFIVNPDANAQNSDIARMYNSSVQAATYAPQDRCMALTITINAILAEKAGIGWTTFAHTGTQVSVSAIGAGSQNFTGTFDNTDIHHKLSALLQKQAR